MQTFIFESAYREDDAGARTDIVIAPDRDTALRVAAMAVIVDNDWADDRLITHSNLLEFYESELEILYEWTDLDGAACPNCTNHGTRKLDNGYHHCETCGYCFTGHMSDFRLELEGKARELIAEVDAFEHDWFSNGN